MNSFKRNSTLITRLQIPQVNEIEAKKSQKSRFISPKKKTENAILTSSSRISTDWTSSFHKSAKRKSVMTPSINTSLAVLKMINANQKDAEKKVLEKKRYAELNQLSKERARLKQSLLSMKDPKSLDLLSRKIYFINSRISRLMRELNGQIVPQERENNKKAVLSDKVLDLDDINFTSMKEDMKKIEGFLKIAEINHEIDLMDVNYNGIIHEKPSFYFQRKKKKSLYEPSTEAALKRYSNSQSTVYRRSFRPSGFRAIKTEATAEEIPTTFEDVFFESVEKNRYKKKKKTNNQTNTFDDSDNSNSDFFCLSSARTRPKTEGTISSSRPKTSACFRTKSREKKVLNVNAENKKKFKKNVESVMNDTRIIKESIIDRVKEESKAVEKANRPKYFKVKKRKEKKTYEPVPLPKPKSDEETYIDALEKIPGCIKKEYREVFKKMLTEDRLLNRPDPRYINPYDQKVIFLKEQKQFQQEAFKTMYVLKENIVTGKEDDIFKDAKVFDDFNDLESLKWLVQKKNILEKHSKFTGAYNPLEKISFDIHYP